MNKPQRTRDNLVAAWLMIRLWQEFGSVKADNSIDNDGLRHDFMGAPEDAGEWLGDLGLVEDVGWHFELTEAGHKLMEFDDLHAMTPERLMDVVYLCD